MNNSEPFEISISNPEAAFKDHLALPGNTRIIFSAPFGTGKTYFLKKFFGEKNPTVFHLYPVNYSVSSNEDIFELVKYDLLFQLLKPYRGIQFEDIKYSISQRVFLALNDPSNDAVVSKLFSLVPKVGAALSILYDEVSKLRDKLAPKKQKDEKNDIENSKRKIEKKEGSIHEMNDLSELVKDLISRTKKNKIQESDKENESKKWQENESILIIDDLDRIDPEHIFRLLNVFAAHFDINKDENKFGVDQVIFVCDVENIRKIFANKYGQDADFNGYIDKFYSTQIFYFDNTKMLSQSIDSILDKSLFNKDESLIFEHNIAKLILETLIQENVINLRVLLKFTDSAYELSNKNLNFESISKESVEITYFYVFEFIYRLFGNVNSYLSSLKRIAHKKHIDDDVIGSFLMIVGWRTHRFNNNVNNTFSVNINEKDYECSIEMDPGASSKYYGKVNKAVSARNSSALATRDDYFEAFYQAAKTLVELRILK